MSLRTFRAGSALLLALLLALGSGWILFSVEWNPHSLEDEVQQNRIAAVFVISLILSALLLVRPRRSKKRPTNFSPESVPLPWWTDSLGTATSDSVVTLNDRALIRSVNYSFEEMFGYTARQVIGQSLFRVIVADAEFSEAEGLAGADTKDGIRMRVRGKRMDGAEFPVELRLTRFERGSAKMYLGVCRELPQSPASEDGDTAATPVGADWASRFMEVVGESIDRSTTTILGYTDVAVETLKKDDPLQADVNEIKETAAHIARLSQLLQILGRAPTAAGGEMDLHEWLLGFEKTLCAGTGSAEPPVLELNAARPVVRLQRAYLGIVMSYLLDGLRASQQPGSPIKISTENTGEPGAGGFVVIEISGRNPVHNSSSLAYEVVRGILAKSQGAFEIQTDSEEGTSFRISLPAV